MGQGKQRTVSQIKGGTGVEIIKKIFPKYWVIRELNPDYGIDLDVELFIPYGDNYITAGEHIYFQVKTTDVLEKEQKKVFQRSNVEKGVKIGKEFKVIEVVKHQLDTNLLSTVERMGSAVPVMLALVDAAKEEIYFVCLNDYIEKIILPQKPNYSTQETFNIDIPVSNLIKTDKDVLPIEWYAKRAKLFAFFNKVAYQYDELQHCMGYEILERGKYFANILLKLDAWSATNYFYMLKSVKEELDNFANNGITNEALKMINIMKERGEDVSSPIYESSVFVGEASFEEIQRCHCVLELWRKMNNCGSFFEDWAKEWFLPTFVGLVSNDDWE